MSLFRTERRGRGRSLVAVVFLAFLGLVGTAGPVAAEPSFAFDYPRPELAYEGRYPQNTPCAGAFSVVQTKKVTWGGMNATFRMYYHRNCGAYIRVDNMFPECHLKGFRQSPENAPIDYFGIVYETSDGLTYAYTMMMNNLNYRLAWGHLRCYGQTVAELNPF